MIWFVISKPIAEFRGSIAKVLNHYDGLLQKKDIELTRTDPSCPIEARELDWLQKTDSYQKHQDAIEILPHFPI
jgi:hypothetical protein